MTVTDGFSTDRFHREYETDTVDMTIQGKGFQLYHPRTLDRFIDSKDPLHRFPLWAKIWEASWVLADFVAGMPPDPDKKMLETGGGVGLVSIVAASFGHRITMTESDDRAINFATANAALNGVKNLNIEKLDWNQPCLIGRFDTIIAAEVAYHEDNFKPLENLFNTHLEPTGEIVLASGMRNSSMAFLNFLSKTYKIRAQKKTLRPEDGEKTTIVLARMSPTR